MLKSLRRHSQLLGRLRQIVAVLSRHGFYDIVRRLSLHGQLSPLDRMRYARLHHREDKQAAIHLRQAFEELGPSFVEFGQLLSTRNDLIPDTFAKELSLLFARTQPIPWPTIRQTLPDSFTGKDSPFASIEQEPLASASIAQIHRAILKDSGTAVIIKVQRPDIEKVIRADLDVLRVLASLAEKYLPESRSLNPVQMVEEFSSAISQELDFILEATHMARFSRLFLTDPYILTPAIYWDLSHPQVLVMDYLDGIPLTNMAALRQSGAPMERIAEHLLHAFLKQIFLFGFFHADPHPGNFLVLEGGHIAFIDFGLMGYLSKEERRTLSELLRAALAEDLDRVAALWLEIAHAEPNQLDATAFRRGLEPIIGKQLHQPYERVRLRDIFLEMIQNGARHGLTLPRELFLLFRTLAEVEGLLRMLYPRFDIIAQCREFDREQQAAAMQSSELLRVAGEEVREWAGIASRLPREVESLLKAMATGRFTLDLGQQGFDYLTSEVDRSSNRITLGLIVAALIASASLMFLANAMSPMQGLWVAAVASFTVGGVLGLWLLWRVFRSGKY